MQGSGWSLALVGSPCTVVPGECVKILRAELKRATKLSKAVTQPGYENHSDSFSRQLSMIFKWTLASSGSHAWAPFLACNRQTSPACQLLLWWTASCCGLPMVFQQGWPTNPADKVKKQLYAVLGSNDIWKCKYFCGTSILQSWRRVSVQSPVVFLCLNLHWVNVPEVEAASYPSPLSHFTGYNVQFPATSTHKRVDSQFIGVS